MTLRWKPPPTAPTTPQQ